MYFVGVEQLTTVVELEDVNRNQDMVYHHFMNYGDEVFYVLNKGRIYGIITPGDLARNYRNKTPLVNQMFKYVSLEDDIESAKGIFEKYSTVHEVAVVKDEVLRGVIKSGKRKTAIEWRKIRDSFKSREKNIKKEFIQGEIIQLLETKAQVFIYPYLMDIASDLNITQLERNIFEEKRFYMQGPKDISAMTKKEQREFFGQYAWKYREEFGQRWSELRLEYKNGVAKYQSISRNALYTIDENGNRIVPCNKNLHAKRRVYTVGPCTMFGVYVANEETIQTYLQRMLVESNFEDYEVINLSVSAELGIARLFTEEISADDIIIIMTNAYQVWKSMEQMYPEQITCVTDLGSIWDKIDNPLSCLYDSYNHCNWRVNREIAYKMYEDIKGSLSKEIKDIHRERLQDYYIAPDIFVYYRRHFLSYVGERKTGKIGAIVMNCNPFTKGHRYLIERAARQVDHLYVFVVEEDKSVFSFADRYEMVQAGTQDLANVSVLPSGDYIISQKTFEQYFTKDQVEVVEDMDYDVRIFGKVVAQEFGITVRFVGEEPYDKVTRNYNETMHRILPEYGIDVVEIPRVSNETGEIISASKVRKYLQENNTEALQSMLPNTTLEYLLKE